MNLKDKIEEALNAKEYESILPILEMDNALINSVYRSESGIHESLAMRLVNASHSGCPTKLLRYVLTHPTLDLHYDVLTLIATNENIESYIRSYTTAIEKEDTDRIKQLIITSEKPPYDYLKKVLYTQKVTVLSALLNHPHEDTIPRVKRTWDMFRSMAYSQLTAKIAAVQKEVPLNSDLISKLQLKLEYVRYCIYSKAIHKDNPAAIYDILSMGDNIQKPLNNPCDPEFVSICPISLTERYPSSTKVCEFITNEINLGKFSKLEKSNQANNNQEEAPQNNTTSNNNRSAFFPTISDGNKTQDKVGNNTKFTLLRT